MKQTLLKYQTQLLAVAVLVGTFIVAQPPTLSQAEQADLRLWLCTTATCPIGGPYSALYSPS